MINQELLAKYSDKVEQYLNILALDDEILYKAIVSNSELVLGWAGNIKKFAEKGDLGAVEETIKELRKSVDNMETMLNEAVRRAYENRINDNGN